MNKVLLLGTIAASSMLSCNSDDQVLTGTIGYGRTMTPGEVCYSVDTEGQIKHTLVQNGAFYNASSILGKSVTIKGELDHSARCEAVSCECTDKIHIKSIAVNE